MRAALTLFAAALALAVAAAAAFAAADSADPMLNVFVVSHSHDDPGWIHTVDGYYENEVQYIYTSVVKALLENPNRRFICVEISFFSRWWADQDETTQNQFKGLLKNGQIEFILGGWVMEDEAVSSFEADVNQMTLGHEYLRKVLGVTPNIAWHIDPFGASSVTPTMWSMAGMDAFVINRIDYRLKAEMKQQQSLEFWWDGSETFGNQRQMFTHVLDSHYCSPDGFFWEHGPQEVSDPAIVVNAPSPLTPPNVKDRADLFVNITKTRAAWYKTNNMLIPLGCDFRYQNAYMIYKNMDLLMSYINENSAEYGVKVQYSTLSDYFAAVRASWTDWPLWNDDFLPYADTNTSYWSGFYSSRPTVKSLSRSSGGVLRNAETLASVTLNTVPVSSVPLDPLFYDLNLLRSAHALVQHHDAVAGTETAEVAADYVARIELGEKQLSNDVAGLAQRLVTKTGGQAPELSTDLEVVDASVVQGETAALVLYNSLGWTRRELVRMCITVPGVSVLDGTQAAVASQVSALTCWNGEPYTLDFVANVPALGFATYFVTPNGSAGAPVQPSYGRDFTLQNEFTTLTFADGSPSNLANHASARSSRLQVAFRSYQPAVNHQASGAYIFRPNLTLPVLHVERAERVEVIAGPLVQEARVYYSWSSIVSTYRLVHGLDAAHGAVVDASHAIGPVNVSTGGQEVTVVFGTDVASGDVFYTDDTAVQVRKRVRNLAGRPGDNDPGVALAGNFYPVTSRAFVRDANQQFTVVTDASRAGSSLAAGELEIMIHRRLLVDDARGVGEPLNDTSIATLRTWLSLDTIEQGNQFHRTFSTLSTAPLLPLAAETTSAALYAAKYVLTMSALKAPLPANVHLLSFNLRDRDEVEQIVVRLQHIYSAVDEPSPLTKPVQLDVGALVTFAARSIEERTLTLMHPIGSAVHAPEFVPVHVQGHQAHSAPRASFPITLATSDVRTFIMTTSA